MSTETDQSNWVIEFSAEADRAGWDEAVRKARACLDSMGSDSIEAAIEGDTQYGGSISGDRTLGGVVLECAVVSKGGERIVRFGNSRRWIAELALVTYQERSTALNDVADAIESVVSGVSGLDVRSEPVEDPEDPAVLIILRSSGLVE